MTIESVGEPGQIIAELMQSLNQVVLGQEQVVRDVVLGLLARGHVLLEGPPGTAKTLVVRALNQSLGLGFRRIQFTPDLMPSDITGVSVLGGDGNFTFRPGPLFADIVLADEINRAPSKTQAALLEAMQERSITVDGTSHRLSRFFTVYATQNAIEFEGTYPLPEAELDRFLLKSLVGYPSSIMEEGVLQRALQGFDADDPASFGISAMLDHDKLRQIQNAARSVTVEDSLVGYMIGLVRATRESSALTLGASTRAAVALLKVSQAMALLDGRDFVIPDDVKAIAPAVLRHRIVLAPDLELEGITADQALAGIIERVPVPR